MSAIDLQSAIGDTLLQMVLEQKAQKQREVLIKENALQQELAQQKAEHISAAKVYAKAA